MSQFFSYCPRTGGSRVILARPAHGLVICHMPQRCTVAAGDLVVLSYWTARPGLYWRGDAQHAAREIVAQVGGLAEDACGTVTLAVPRHAAPAAHRVMTTLDPDADARHADLADPNLLALWRAGLGRLSRGLDAFFVDADPRGHSPRLGEDGRTDIDRLAGRPRGDNPATGMFSLMPVPIRDRQPTEDKPQRPGERLTGREALRVGVVLDTPCPNHGFIWTFAEVTWRGHLPESVDCMATSTAVLAGPARVEHLSAHPDSEEVRMGFVPGSESQGVVRRCRWPAVPTMTTPADAVA